MKIGLTVVRFFFTPKVFRYTYIFSWHMFTKGDNCCDFLFASLDGETLLKLYLLLKKEFAQGANSYL